MTKMTIQEGLSEARLIQNKVEKKQRYIHQNLWRLSNNVDPLADSDGSEAVIDREMQAVADLQLRLIKIRVAIQTANLENTLKVHDHERPIAEWIIWKREVLPIQKRFYDGMATGIVNARNQMRDRPLHQVSSPTGGEIDVINHVNVDELASWIEELQELDDILDGRLTLRNAQIEIEV
jgi:hypothetical protein